MKTTVWNNCIFQETTSSVDRVDAWWYSGLIRREIARPFQGLPLDGFECTPAPLTERGFWYRCCFSCDDCIRSDTIRMRFYLSDVRYWFDVTYSARYRLIVWTRSNDWGFILFAGYPLCLHCACYCWTFPRAYTGLMSNAKDFEGTHRRRSLKSIPTTWSTILFLFFIYYKMLTIFCA